MKSLHRFRDVLLTLLVLGGLFVLFRMTRPAPPSPVYHGAKVAGNAYDFLTGWKSSKSDLDTRLAQLPEVLQFAEYKSQLTGGSPPTAVPNFLEYQVLVKVARVKAEFALMQGRRTDALLTFQALHYMGELMARNGMNIEGLIGIAIQAITLGGLEHAVQNACETSDSRQLVWEVLDDLNARTITPTKAVVQAKAGVLARIMHGANFEEVLARHRTSFTKLKLLRAAAAAQEQRALSGAFPATAADFAPRLPAGPDPDPFADPPAPLEWSAGTLEFKVWSIGPDKTSQGGGVTYDPTNGALSGGDIPVVVARDRKFPFPTSGTLLTARDLTAFGSGLPADPFADTRGKGYTVSSLAGTSTTIASYGPDTDQSRRTTTGAEVSYDPTNGIISDGDLVLPLPD